MDARGGGARVGASTTALTPLQNQEQFRAQYMGGL